MLLLAACASPPPRFALPEEAGADVLVLDQRPKSGPRPRKEPLIRYAADGTMRTGAGEARLEPEELQDLLAYVIDEKRFFDLDTEAIRLKLHQENSRRGSALAVLRAPVSVIEVRLRDRTHRVEVHALQFQANTHPTIAALQQLAAIERKLVRSSSVALLGGTDGAARVLALANEELARRYPQRTALALTDLAGVGRRKDGARVAHFRRDESAREVSYVIVLLPVDGEPTAMMPTTPRDS